MPVVEEQDAAAAQGSGDAARPGRGIAEPRERAEPRVDEIPAAEEDLRRQHVRVRVQPGDLGRAPARRLDDGCVLVDAGHVRAELGELDRLAPGAAEEVEDAAPADARQPLADRGREPGRREHVLRRAMRVVEGAAVVVGRLHLGEERVAAVDDDRLAAHHRGVGGAEEGDGAPRRPRG